MRNEKASELLKHRQERNGEERCLTVKLTARSCAIIKRWECGNARETVAQLLEIADEELSKAEAETEKQAKNKLSAETNEKPQA